MFFFLLFSWVDVQAEEFCIPDEFKKKLSKFVLKYDLGSDVPAAQNAGEIYQVLGFG